MSSDTFIIICGWLITAVMLLLFVPKVKIRQAFVVFMFKQLITWPFGLVVVNFRLIEYSVRSFANVYKSSFDFEYFIYPSFCVIFNLHYPEGKSFIRRSLHYIYYCSALTSVEVLVERFTNILEYLHWTWYVSFITFFITFFISHQFYKWFFKIEEKNQQSPV